MDLVKNPAFRIYVHGFWSGFIDKTDANHIGFFQNLFSKTKMKNFTFTTDINTANVLFESLFNGSMSTAKQWLYKIHYTGEAYSYNLAYDIVLASDATHDNIVDVPLAVYYIYTNNFLNGLEERKVKEVPPKFCCFIVSNPNGTARNHMFNELNKYKSVDSLGRFNNNVGFCLEHNYWTQEYRDFIKQYKFIICFENTKCGTYVTEKIVNPLLAGIIPIYWGTHHVKNIFNKDTFLMLEDESNEAVDKLIAQIRELDEDDSKYLDYVNRPVFTPENRVYWSEHYTIEKIAESMDALLSIQSEE